MITAPRVEVRNQVRHKSDPCAFANAITEPTPGEIVDIGQNESKVHVEGTIVSGTYDKVAVACFHINAIVPPPTDAAYTTIKVIDTDTTFEANVEAGSVGGTPNPPPPPENNNKVVAHYREIQADPNAPEVWVAVLPVINFYVHETMS